MVPERIPRASRNARRIFCGGILGYNSDPNVGHFIRKFIVYVEHEKNKQDDAQRDGRKSESKKEVSHSGGALSVARQRLCHFNLQIKDRKITCQLVTVLRLTTTSTMEHFSRGR